MLKENGLHLVTLRDESYSEHEIALCPNIGQPLHAFKVPVVRKVGPETAV